MSWKVKRGLGLLVVAVIGMLAVLALLQLPYDGSPSFPVAMGIVAATIAMLGGLIGGLGLLAWGLLRD